MKQLASLFVLLSFAVGCGGGLGGEKDQSASTNCSLSGQNNVQVCGNSDSTITATQEQPSAESEGGSTVSRFVWKPASESDGNLAVLVNPEGIDILVSGAIAENLTDSGPSNGYGTTGRGSLPGCDYGENITVQFFKDGKLVETESGATSILVEDGCSRAEVVL